MGLDLESFTVCANFNEVDLEEIEFNFFMLFRVEIVCMAFCRACSGEIGLALRLPNDKINVNPNINKCIYVRFMAQ